MKTDHKSNVLLTISLLVAMAVALPIAAWAQGASSNSSGGYSGTSSGGYSGSPSGGYSGSPAGGYSGTPSGGYSGSPNGAYSGGSNGSGGYAGGGMPPGAGAPATSGYSGAPGMPGGGMVPGASAPATGGYSGAPGMAGAVGPIAPGMSPGSAPNTQFNVPSPGAASVGTNNPGTSLGTLLNGTGITPSDAAKMLQSISPTTLSSMATQMGITPDEMQAIKNQVSNGGLSSNEIDLLSAKLTSKGMSDANIGSIGAALGLTDSQLAAIRARSAQFQNQNGQPQQMQTMVGTQTGMVGQNGNPGFQLSSMERSFQQAATGQVNEFATPEELYQYGYSMFNGQVSTFAPVGNVPVSSDYIVGPGDEFRVLVWGRVNDAWSLEVQRNGQVEVPQVGPIQVGGLTFDQAKKLIESKTGQMTGVHADVTMGNLRTIQVFIVGEVLQPGPYTISALSRISNGLAAAGGISKIGTLRKIQLRRHNQLVQIIDLYAILMHGDTSADIRLQQDDVIYVPVIGPAFGIAGIVKRPAIYEMLHPTERLSDAVALAGGVGPFAYTQRIQVQRVENHVRRIVLDTAINQMAAKNFETIDGDLIKVFPVLPDQKNKVTLVGNVFRPGDYQWYKEMHLSDLVSLGEGVQAHTYFKYALIKRLEGVQRYPHYLPIDLGKALNSPRGADNVLLQAADEVTIFSEDSLRDLPTVTVTGEVRMPGQYRLDPRMRVSDLVYMAGGFRDSAYRERATLARTQVVDGAHTEHTYVEVDLRAALAPASQNDFLLVNNDQLFVRSASNWHLPWTATVSGRVKRPGVYAVREGETLDELLDASGGFLPDAFPKGLIFTRASVRAVEQARLDQTKQRLSQDLMQVALTVPMGQNSGSDNAQGGALQVAQLQGLLSQAQNTQADGRIVIKLSDSSGRQAISSKIVLEDGDNITIPVRPMSVNVLGQVNNPTSILCQRGWRTRDYLYKAGGPASNADLENMMVIQADGTVLTDAGLKNTGQGRYFPALPLISGGLLNTRLEAGDTIYVPEDVQTFVKLERQKDLWTIFASAAQTLGIIGLLATRL